MQNSSSGQFDYVLMFPTLEKKEKLRIIYYNGEAAFALSRLYGHTKNAVWLEIVEKAFGDFMKAGHAQAHDYWLPYSVNELTRYRSREEYYRFGIDNFATYLDFVTHRITTFSTLLELMMAVQQMVDWLRQDEIHGHLLEDADLEKFDTALHTRALFNGHFWPELAMYHANPSRIVGSFFIRHHSFRVRIDDVEHYLSGLVANTSGIDLVNQRLIQP